MTEQLVVRTDQDDGLTTLTLNRPDNLNALGPDDMSARKAAGGR